MSTPTRQILSIDVGDLRARIEAQASAEGTRPGPWVKQVIESALSTSSKPSDPSRAAVPHAASNRRLNGGQVKFTARLSEAESAALAAGAAAAGLSQAEYLGRLATGNTARAAPSAPDLLAALADSNHQLVALGRNLNQIARSLNAYPGRMTAADRKLILVTAEAARHHIEVVARHLGEMKATRRSKAKRSSMED